MKSVDRIVVVSMFHSLIRHRGIMTGAACLIALYLYFLLKYVSFLKHF